MLFIGDSITDCGRRGEHAPLGNGYVRLFSELTMARFPERNIRYINVGVGGNTVVDLRERWQTDVLDQAPDRLLVAIGINDLSRYLYGRERAVGPVSFKETYDQILNFTSRELGCPVVLATPFLISTVCSGIPLELKRFRLLSEYVGIVHAMSERHDTHFLNLNDVFQKQLRYHDTSEFALEPVHPHQAGHMVIANALMELLLC